MMHANCTFVCILWILVAVLSYTFDSMHMGILYLPSHDRHDLEDLHAMLEVPNDKI